MALDKYSMALVLVNFAALLLLPRYFETRFMLVPFGVLLVLQWVWLYRLMEPMGFRIPAAISLVAAVSLYFENVYVWILALAVLVPAVAVAMMKLFKSDQGSSPTPRAN